jgi:hypothetical protein
VRGDCCGFQMDGDDSEDSGPPRRYHSPARVSGPPHFVEQTQCTDNGTVSTGRGWQAANTDVLRPEFPSDCISAHRWIALAGWLNHPVVSIDYTAPTG